MPQKLKLHFSLTALFAFFMLSSASASTKTKSKLKSIPVQLLFETKVEKPSHLTWCNAALWTFSEHNQTLVSINPKDGNIINEHVLDSHIFKDAAIDMAAITCQNNRLFVLINSKKYARIFEIEALNTSLKVTSQAVLPQKARATDLVCSAKKCWLMQEKLFESNDMQTWSQVKIPPSENLKKSLGHPELDPFEDWQSTLILAKDKYIKGAVNAQQQPAFLDPFRSQVVTQKDNEWVKWGAFGPWEGFFLSPKTLLYLNDETLAVADAKLKIISLFSREGLFLGVLTWNSETLYSPEYPLGLASDKNRLFVADFAANKIVALEIKQFKSEVENKGSLNIRNNLFRRAEVLKDAPSATCLNCHDGTISNQLHKYIKMHFHHPLECSQCHDPHHTSKEPHFLRRPEQELCQSCHKSFAEPKTNHVWKSHNKKGGSCIDCHSPHSNAEKLLVEQKPQLCINCHQQSTFSHKPVQDISDLQKSKNVTTDNGQISCQTCHQTHISWKETHFIKEPAAVLNFCSSCHGDKAPVLFKNFHKLIKLKKRTP